MTIGLAGSEKRIARPKAGTRDLGVILMMGTLTYSAVRRALGGATTGLFVAIATVTAATHVGISARIDFRSMPFMKVVSTRAKRP
jgi:hypothetical protein